MAEKNSCTCGGNEKERLLFPCAGQANTGQITNQAAIQLSDEGYGSFVCTALLASGSESLAERARRVNEVVAIDGCGMDCARKIIEQAGVPVHQHLVVTSLGVEKNPEDRSFSPDQVEIVVSAAWRGDGKIQESDGEKKNPGCGCGCSGNCS